MNRERQLAVQEAYDWISKQTLVPNSPVSYKHARALSAELVRIVSGLRWTLQGCVHCDYDEADGGLYRHCARCRHTATRTAYALVSGSIRVDATPHDDHKPQTAKQSEEVLEVSKLLTETNKLLSTLVDLWLRAAPQNKQG